MKVLALTKDTLDMLRVISLTLPDLIGLPDPEAAEGLNQRMALLDGIEKVHEISYSQRLVIIREFEIRKLWQYLTDPMVGQPFPHLTAWLSSGFIGCRRVNMEAHRDAERLADVPPGKLLDVPKGNIKVLTQLSTAVRNEPGILETARTASEDELLDKVEKEHPEQHLTVRKRIILRPGRAEARVIEEWVAYAQEHDIAASVTDAVVRACEQALHGAKLDEELAKMPTEEVTA